VSERLGSPVTLVTLTALGAAVLLGFVAGISPPLAIGAAFGAAFVALVLQNVTYGICAMAFLAPLDGVPAIGGGAVSAPKLAGVLLGISWLATLASRRDEQLFERRPLFTYAIVVFLAWQAVSIGWAESRDGTIQALTRYAPNLLFFPIAYSAVRTEKHLRWVLLAIVLATFVSGVLGLVGPADPTAVIGDDRAQGLAGGSNELAAALVAGIVLALALAAVRPADSPGRLAYAGIAAIATLALFLSLSRGGLVAFGAALVLAVVVAGRWRGRVLAAALTLAAACVVYFGAFASLPARERVLDVGAGGTGRTDLWTVGLRMIEDRPLEGVGAGNFAVASIHYLLEPGAIQADEFIITRPKVAHNTVLQVFAETGVVGGVLWVGIVGSALWWMLAAARSFARSGARDMEVLARATFVATCGYLVAGLFQSANYSKLLWLLLALGPVLAALARRRASSSA
jgi:O-antigen ligase